MPDTGPSKAGSISSCALVSLRVFLLGLAINITAAIIVFLKLEYLFVDSISRTMHASFVFWGKDAPHLAAIGFIWMPLPTLIQLPFVLWKPMVQTGLAGGLQSAICMAGALVALDALLRKLHAGTRIRWAMLLVFQFHPMILIYAANGMSEAMLICVTLWACYFFYSWTQTGKSSHLVLLGTTAALAIMTRYEGFAVAAAAAVAIAAAGLRDKHDKARLGGELLAYLAPPVYLTIMWIHFNDTIMGDPLYFYRGAYSNLGQIAFFPKELNALTHNPILTTSYVAQRIFQMAPVYIPATLVVVGIALRRLDTPSLGVILLPGSLLAFGWLNQFQGQSYGWFRFFIYAVPGMILAIAILHKPAVLPSQVTRFTTPVLLAAAVLGSLITGPAILDHSVGREEFPLAEAALKWQPVDRSGAVEYRILDYLDRTVHGRDVLLDDFSGLELIRLAGGTEKFVAGIDTDFRTALEDPRGRVQYILVPKPEGLGTLDAINRRYPNMFMGLEPFVELEQDWGQWRLFRVVK